MPPDRRSVTLRVFDECLLHNYTKYIKSAAKILSTFFLLHHKCNTSDTPWTLFSSIPTFSDYSTLLWLPEFTLFLRSNCP